MHRHSSFPTSGLLGVINLSKEKPGALRFAATPEAALCLAEEYREAGFSAIDLGAQSSHYSVRRMDAHEQIDILVPVVEKLHLEGFSVAIETSLPEVIAAAADAGATCTNLSGSARDRENLEIIAANSMALIASFTPRDSPHDVDDIDIDTDLRAPMLDTLHGNVQAAQNAGISNIIVDAGIGYSYQMPYSEYRMYQVDTIRKTPELARAFDLPTLIAVPRIDDEWLVAAFAAISMESGASMLRCHDPQVGAIGKLLGFLPA